MNWCVEAHSISFVKQSEEKKSWLNGSVSFQIEMRLFVEFRYLHTHTHNRRLLKSSRWQTTNWMEDKTEKWKWISINRNTLLDREERKWLYHRSEWREKPFLVIFTHSLMHPTSFMAAGAHRHTERIHLNQGFKSNDKQCRPPSSFIHSDSTNVSAVLTSKSVEWKM